MKYRAKATDGYPSKLEAAVGALLRLRERQGEIKDIRRQVPVVLQDGPREVRITWRIDFAFIETKTNALVYAEAKGIETPEYKLKLKMYRANPPAALEIYKGTHARPFMAERIEK